MGDGAGFGRIVRESKLHQDGPEVGIAKAELPEGGSAFGDGSAWVRCHVDGDIECNGPEPDCMTVGVKIQGAIGLQKFDQIE